MFYKRLLPQPFFIQAKTCPNIEKQKARNIEIKQGNNYLD